jgi:hypothetical protein
MGISDQARSLLDSLLANTSASMKGDAAMTQGVIVGVLLTGLMGLLWVIVLDLLGNNHHSHDNRQENPSPEPHDGEEPHEISPRKSKVAA